MAEQLICNQQVVGSTPITSSIEETSFVYQGKGVSFHYACDLGGIWGYFAGTPC